MGVLHGDEIDYVFGNPLNKSRKYTKDEVNLSERIMKHYKSFATYGWDNSYFYIPITHIFSDAFISLLRMFYDALP